MMRHPEHHPVPPTAMQRSNRISIQQMTPPAQRMLMTVQGSPHSGVLVSMPPGPTLITTTAIAPIQQQHPQQQQQQQKNNSVPVYYDAHTLNEEQTDIPAEQHQAQVTNTTTSSAVPNLANIKEKTPMCLVNELARYNKIQHQYRLTGEQGPAHKKIFTVTLKLGNEEYEAEGPSIKKAQHSAAAQALAKTQLKHPPPKTARSTRPGMRTGTTGMVTPTVELNALAMKRGERTVYIVENGPTHHPQTYMAQAGGYYPRHNLYSPQGQPRYNCDIRRNHQVRGHYQYDNRYYSQFKPGFQHTNGEICNVRLRIGDREYSGSGISIQAARHDAAAKAIEDIKRLNAEEGRIGEDSTEEQPLENGDTDVNTELKSPISLVHEIALKRHLNVVFEVLSEKGPPHMKVFVTQCRIGDIVVEGEGNGKKKSKKRAAEKMLEKLAKFPPLPNINNVSQLKKKRSTTNKKKTRNLIKVNSDKSADFTEEINPISRLIQIQQANKEKEPDYNVVEERGAPRRREFVIQASVNGLSCNGVGPNKKIAKRNAAQALLSALGYINPSPPAQKQNTIINKNLFWQRENLNNANNYLQENDATSKLHKRNPVPPAEKEPETIEKPRKVTFLEEKQQDSPVGGSGGRQLVPGLLLVGDQSITMQNKSKPLNENSSNANGSDKKMPTKIPPPPPQGVRSKDKLLYLAQLLNIHVQFSDFPKANHEMYLTLVSLNTNPPQVCHGEGPTTEASHEKAAMEALNALSELGLDNIAPCKENTTEGVKTQMTPKAGLTQNGNKK